MKYEMKINKLAAGSSQQSADGGQRSAVSSQQSTVSSFEFILPYSTWLPSANCRLTFLFSPAFFDYVLLISIQAHKFFSLLII
jgi:hypothetical protein